MSILIKTSDALRTFIPNTIKEVKGEVPLFDKLEPYILMAENWLNQYFIPYAMFRKAPSIAIQLVAIEAYRIAVPQLNVVLTPNGFATVGTQNLSPASKMRVDRLVAGLTAERDKCVAQLLHELPKIDGWLNTSQGEWFAATLFPTFDVLAQSGVTENLWEHYCELHTKLIDLEASLAEEWFSTELMSALRSENISETLSGVRKEITKQIQAQLIAYLREGSFNARRLADIVNIIRSHKGDFSEWHLSATASLFSPPIFQNSKDARGYFF